MQDIDYGQILEALNDKTDRDLGNLSAEGRATGGGLSFPSSRSIQLTSPTHGSTYTAVADGWFKINGTSTATGSWISFGVLGQGNVSENVTMAYSGWARYFIFPATKGVTYEFTCSNITNTTMFFIFAIGSENN